MAREKPAANLNSFYASPLHAHLQQMTRHAHSVHAVGDSAEQDLIRRGGEEEKAEDLLSREQLEEARTSCCRGSAPLCVQSNSNQCATWQEGQGRRTGGRGGLRTACLQLPNHAPGPHSNNAHRSGLVVIFAHPGRREWRGSGEGVKGSGGKLVNTELKRAKHIS